MAFFLVSAFNFTFDITMHLSLPTTGAVVFASLFATSLNFLGCAAAKAVAQKTNRPTAAAIFFTTAPFALADVETNRHGEIERLPRHVCWRRGKRLRALDRVDCFLVKRR